MLEDIDRRMKLGMDSMSAAKESAVSMAGPVLASTLAIVAVFVPILVFEGIARDLFGPLAMTVTACMFASYLFSIAVVPLAAGLFLRNKAVSPNEVKRTGFDRALNSLESRYENSLKKMVTRPMFLGAIMVALTAMAGFGVTQTGYELFPKEDVGQLEIQVRMPSGTTLSSSENTIAQMEEVVRNELGTDIKIYPLIGKPITFSGWDYANKSPKPSRYAIPPGSVYFVEFNGGFKPNKPYLKLGDLTRLGYGLCFVGVW
jgi:multidrug efflux pump subunit AcrB